MGHRGLSLPRAGKTLGIWGVLFLLSCQGFLQPVSVRGGLKRDIAESLTSFSPHPRGSGEVWRAPSCFLLSSTLSSI